MTSSAVLCRAGVASAQGSLAELATATGSVSASPLPWPTPARGVGRWCWPARGVGAELWGGQRWRALALAALEECFPAGAPPGVPLVVASCNGGANRLDDEEWARAFELRQLLAGTEWADAAAPVVSASCASGLLALWLARRLLAGGVPEVAVLAVDVLSPSSEENFEALRVLAPEPTPPWRPTSLGFVAGEAAVALQLRSGRDGGVPLAGPVAALDGSRVDGPGIEGHVDGLARALKPFLGWPADLVFGQGTGPPEVDAAELTALADAGLDGRPRTTASSRFGHTLGASGPLALALAWQSIRSRPPAALALPPEPASSSSNLRPVSRSMPVRSALVAGRALGGSCAAVGLGGGDVGEASAEGWGEPSPPGPLHHPLLRRLAEEAAERRPVAPPAAVVVHLDHPLEPPPRAILGGRLLPSAVLEITPGFVAGLIARSWGFYGPVLTLVGGGRRGAAELAAELPVIYISVGQQHVEWY